MKKITILLVFCLFVAASSYAQVEIIKTEEGDQAIISENKRLTVFKDSPISEGDYICVYLDSSLLEEEGYNIIEYYILNKIDKHYVTVGMTKAKIQLPLYLITDEEYSESSVPLGGFTVSTGTFLARGIKIKITVTDAEHITAEILD
ncbi:MAG: hypothetical protein GF409_01050 [Candidatus Omnitrophica bacterium]|nr:hypothetical protein [Candidatus Omnitrophota bacterium]